MTVVRRAGTVSAATLFGLALALTLAHTAAPRWSRQAGLDVWNFRAALTDARSVGVQTAEIRRYEEQLREQVELADSLTAMLANGRVSLAEATDTLEPDLQNRPGFSVVAFVHHKAPTLRHGVARYLIARVGRHLLHSPIQCAITIARLEAEYAAMT